MARNSKTTIVSVCVITYNHQNYIVETLKSILAQDGHFTLQVIVADDCSIDKTKLNVAAFLKQHPKKDLVSFTSHKTNKGMMPNFLWALSQCTGDYIALCDGDDYWIDNSKLNKQVSFLEENSDYVLSFHPTKFLKMNTGAIVNQNLRSIDYKYSVKNILQNWAIPTASMVFRRTTVFDTLPKWLSTAASGELPLVLFHYKLGKFKLFKEYMSVYRQNGDGVSQYHVGTRMIHYRAHIHTQLNTYFNFEYEKEIYEALHAIIQQNIPELKPKKESQDLITCLKNTIKNSAIYAAIYKR